MSRTVLSAPNLFRSWSQRYFIQNRALEVFLIFLFISWLSYGHKKGPKVLPSDWNKNRFFVSQMSIKCQNFSPKFKLWKIWPFIRESNEDFFSKAHQTGTRWPWLDMIWFFYSFWVVEKGCKVILLKSWHGKR